MWGDVPLLAIVLNLRKDLHLSHYTAMRIHGLTEQQPTTIYLTDERSTQAACGVLAQSDINAAFSHPARLASDWVEFGGQEDLPAQWGQHRPSGSDHPANPR